MSYTTYSAPAADLDRNLSRISYARDALGRQKTTQRSDIARRFADVREAQPGTFNRRGMINSGVRRRAYGRTISDQLRAQQNLRTALQDKLAGLDFQQMAAEDAFARELQSAALADAQRRADTAAMLTESY